jgi:hypothetical protein
MLGDNAFESELAGVREDGDAVALNVLAELDPGPRPGEQFPQLCALAIFLIYINTKPQEGAKLMVSMGETPYLTVRSGHRSTPILPTACRR